MRSKFDPDGELLAGIQSRYNHEDTLTLDRHLEAGGDPPYHDSLVRLLTTTYYYLLTTYYYLLQPSVNSTGGTCCSRRSGAADALLGSAAARGRGGDGEGGGVTTAHCPLRWLHGMPLPRPALPLQHPLAPPLPTKGGWLTAPR